MKKIFLFLLSFAFVSLNAQTVDEIIQKYADAMGGLTAFNKVKMIKMEGIIGVQGVEIPFTTEIINGKAMRLDAEYMGQNIVNCYNNGSGWKINPFAGITTAEDASGSELYDLKAQASIANNLMDYKARQHIVELQGEEIVDGKATSKIKLIAKEDGRITYYYITKTDNTLIKTVTNREMQGQQVEMETSYSNLKDFAGLKFSMSITQKMNGQDFQSITMTNVDLNATVDEKIFNK